MRNPPSRTLPVVLKNAIDDIPAWARSWLIVAGLAGAVVVAVASLEGGQEQTVGVDKLLHFGGYATLAAIFVLGLRPVLFVPALLMLAGMGWAIEFLQPANSRTFDLGDAAANMTGLAVGAGAGLVVRIAARVVRTRIKLARLERLRRSFGPGATILREGAPVRRFCVIERGKVQLVKDIDGQRTVMGTMGPGDVFGLLGVLQCRPQYATIEAISDTTVYSLDMDDLIEPSQQADPVASVLAALAKQVRELADRVVEAEKIALKIAARRCYFLSGRLA